MKKKIINTKNAPAPIGPYNQAIKIDNMLFIIKFMKIENIPADIKSKSLKEARDEIDHILIQLESKNLNFDTIEQQYKRLISLNKHVESLFKEKFKEINKNDEK